MYPSLKAKDSVHSGTGVYYQAIPAVGADGKNIMKLIPVQMVNGHFFRTDVNKARTDCTPQKAAIQGVKKAALSDIPSHQFVKKQVSSVNTTSNRVELDHGYSLNKLSVQQQAVSLPDKAPSTTTHPANCGRSVRRPCQLQVTRTSPPLTKGHHLPDATNAQVQTIPVSELCHVVKKPTFNLSENSSAGSNSPSVAYLSPTPTVNHGVTPPTNSALDSLKLFSDTSNKAQCRSHSKGSNPHLKLIPKASQRANSPIKWVIEEEETLGKNCDIVQAAAERETSREGSEKTVPRSVLGKSGQGQKNAQVVCNGKVFYLSKKCNVPFKTGQSDPATLVLNCKSHRTRTPSSQQSVEPVLTQTQQDIRIIIPDESDEVIDLCDEEDSTPPAALVDEDNVIFVSYIPPKSESGSTQMALEKETDKTSATRSNCVTKDKSCRTGVNDEDKDRGPPLRGKQPGQMSLPTVKNVACVTNMHRDSNVKSQRCTSTQQLKNVKADVETQSPADTSSLENSSGTSQRGKDTDKMHSSSDPAPCWTSLLPPKPRQMADHVLRQIFGVTADVKICLYRVDETSVWPDHTQPLQSESSLGSVENLHESCKKQKMHNELDLSADPATRTCQTHISIENKCYSGENSCDVRSAAEIGYVEPIEEDFSSTDENKVLTTAHPQSQTCVAVNTKTRLGRTRKRTMCPCCTPGTLGPAVKSAVRSEEPERGAWTAEQISKDRKSVV